MVWGEQIRLEQVLINLFQNAVDAMANSSHGELTICAHEEDGFVHLSVEDNGTGLTPECLPHLFSAFFTTKDGGNGLGLGLYISRGIVEEFGGRILAHTNPGGGSIFEITLLVPEASFPRGSQPTSPGIVSAPSVESHV